jgi:hypothetical protein
LARGGVQVAGSFLTGDQSGNRAQNRVDVLSSAEVTEQSPPVLQVADAMLDADPLRRVGSAFGLVRRGEGGRDWQLIFPSRRARSDDRTGGLRAQALVAGVGQQGDARCEGQQLD